MIKKKIKIHHSIESPADITRLIKLSKTKKLENYKRWRQSGSQAGLPSAIILSNNEES